MSNFTFRIGETDDGKAVKMDLATLIDTKVLNVANSGAGKSYLMRVLIERTAHKVQWIIIDPEGEYASLREKFDFLLVGPEGELPVDLRSAGLLARKIMETRVSTIIDLYGLTELRPQWAAKFLSALLALPKALYTPVMVAIDEAHKFAPETPTGNKEEREHLQQSRKAVITLTDSGRKQSRGAAIATQRLNKLAADARGDLNNNFIGRMVQDLDRERAADILGLKAKDHLILRDLKPGVFFAFGPAFLMDGVFKVKIDTSETRHPKPGERHLLDVPKASDALKQLVSQLGDLPAQAQEEQDALASAQREVARLRNELSTREREWNARPIQVAAPRVETKIEYVEKPVLNGEVKEFVASARDVIQVLTAFPERMAEILNPTFKPLNESLGKVLTKVEQVQNWQAPAPAPPREFVRVPNPTPLYQTPRSSPPTRPAQSGAGALNGTEGLTNPQQRILDALAEFEALGITMPHKSNVAVFSDQSPRSSGFQNNLGRLRTLNYIAYQGSGRVMLTDAGRAFANPAGAIRTLQDLHHAWYARLTRPQSKILEQIIAAYPHPVGKNELAERAGQSATSSGYQNNLGALRSLGLLDYPRAGFVVATTLLFPDGLR